MAVLAPPAEPARAPRGPDGRHIASRRRRWRPPLLPLVVAVIFLGGVVTLLYPSASSWINQKAQSAVVAGQGDAVQQLPAEGLHEAVEQAHRYNAQLHGGGALLAENANVPTASDGSIPTDAALAYGDTLAVDGSGYMARLRIPSIEVDLPIYHGTTEQTLLQGVGHLEGTALPVGGESTHSVLTAHRGLAESTLFTNLDQVEVGDTFTVEVFGEVLTYRVRQTQVVEPTETEALYAQPGEDLITLVTCTPLGINTQRILVTGERITPTPIADVEAAGTPPTIPGFPWWAVMLGGAIVVVGTYVYVSGRPARPKRSTGP